MTKGLGFEPEQHVAVARITIDHETTEDPQYRDEINKKIAKKAVKDGKITKEQAKMIKQMLDAVLS